VLHNISFYLPQIATYVIILPFSLQIALMFFINHAIKFTYRASCVRVKSCLGCDVVQCGTSVPMSHTDMALHLAEYTASHLRTL